MNKRAKRGGGGGPDCETSRADINDLRKRSKFNDDDDDDDSNEAVPKQKRNDGNKKPHAPQKKHTDDLSDVEEVDEEGADAGKAHFVFDRKTIARLFPSTANAHAAPKLEDDEGDEEDVNLTDSDDDENFHKGKPIDPSLFASEEEAHRDWGNEQEDGGGGVGGDDDEDDFAEGERTPGPKPKRKKNTAPKDAGGDDEDDDKNEECIDMPEGNELDKFITYETKDFKKLQRIGGELIRPNVKEKEFLKRAMERCDNAHKKGGVAGPNDKHGDMETPFDDDEEIRKHLGGCGCNLCDKTRPDIPEDSTNLNAYNTMIIHDILGVGKCSEESLIKSNARVFNKKQATARMKGDKSVFFSEEHEIYKHLKDHDFTNVLRPIVEAIGFARTAVRAWRRRIKCKTPNGSIFYSPKNCKMTFYSMDKQIQYQKDYVQTRKYLRETVLKDGTGDTPKTQNAKGSRHIAGLAATGLTRPKNMK